MYTRIMTKNPATASQTLTTGYRRLATILMVIACLGLAIGSATANVRENQDPAGTDQNTNSITAHPDPINGPDWLIASYNDDPFNFNGIGTSFSQDGGVTWFDSFTQVPPVFPVNMDASVASDRMGVVFAGFTSYDLLPPMNQNSGIFVSTSFDNGQNFNPPVGVSVLSGPPGSMPWANKPKVDADGYAAMGSPFAGNAYITFELDLNTTGWLNGPSNAMFSSSVDQGASWAPAMPINDNPGADLVLWPDLDVAIDGAVVTTWTNAPFWVQAQGTLMADRTPDGGMTFGQDVPAVSFWCVPQIMTDQAGGNTRFAMSYTAVAADETNPMHYAAVFPADPDDGPHTEGRVDTGDLPPGSFDAHLLNPRVGASSLSNAGNGYLHAVFMEGRPGLTDAIYNRADLSTGLPIVWDNPDQMVSTQPAMDHSGSNNANIVSNFSNVYVAFDENNGIDFAHLIYFNCSNDDGVTWKPQAIPLDSHFRSCYEPWVTVDGMDHVCVAWLEDQINPADTDIYVNYSLDAGTTFAATEVQVPTTYRAFDHDISSFHDYVQGIHYVFLVWAEETASATGSVIMCSVSTTSGATWSTPVRLDSAPQGQELAYAPKICSDWNNVYVTWIDGRSGNDDIYFNWSNANGLGGWGGEMQLDAPGSRDYYSQIACGQGNVYVVYESDRNNPGGNEDIYLNYSIGGGGNWQGERRVDVGSQPGASHSVYPRITVGGGDGTPMPFVVYMDSRFGPSPFSGWDAFGNHSLDGGATWNPDYRIDKDDQPGRNDTWYPHIDGMNPAYLYEDYRNGTGLADVYANVFAYGPDEGDIFFTETFDGGQTWLNPPLRVNDDPGWNDQSHCWLDIKPNGIIDVVWYDNRNDPNDRNPETYFAAMMPGSGIFTPNVPISNMPINLIGNNVWIGDYIGVVVDSSLAHASWTDNRREIMLFDAFYASMENPQYEEYGACCLPDRSCIETFAGDCAAQGGLFMGNGTFCTPELCDDTGFVDDEGNPLPGSDCVMQPNYPNPFNPVTTVRYALGRAAPVSLVVYDSSGRLVRELERVPLQPAGRHEVSWDGRDASGRTVAAGVYICRLEAGDHADSIRMVLLK